MTARAFPKDIKRKGGKMSGPVSVVCDRCGRRGQTNKALGFKNNQRIDGCRYCKEPK